MQEGYQETIKIHFSGAASEVEAYSGLAIQTIAILVGGIILWRLSNYLYNRKRKQRSSSTFFETPYAKGWKRK